MPDFSGMKKEMSKAQKTLSDFQKNTGKIMKGIGVILGGITVGKLIKDSTAMAMGVESAIGNINRNMGASAKTFQSWVNTQAQSLGIAKSEAYKYGGIFSNLLDSFTGSTSKTAKGTEELMKATAIIANKTGRSYEDTASRIRSGMLGSTEAIEDLGVYTQVSMMETTKAFKKFANGKSWAQLDFQTQQQIRLAAILEQTYARYGDTLADNTQTRQAQFIASLKNIQLSLGQAFLPIYNFVLPALTAMANAIGTVFNYVAQFTTALFGKAADTQKQAQATMQQAQATTSLGKATESAGKKAKKAGKEAKNALAGFDEINSLNKGSGSGGVEGIGAGGGASIPPLDAGGGFADSAVEVSDKVKQITDKIKTLFQPAMESFNNFKIALEPFKENLFAGLKWFWDNILVPFGTWVINEWLPAWLDSLAAHIKVLNSTIDALKPLAIWLWDNFLAPIAAWTGGVIVSVLKDIEKGLIAVSDWITNNKAAVEVIAIVVGSFAAALGLVNLAIGVWNVIGIIATAVTTGFGAAVNFLMSPITLVILAIAAVIAIIVLLVRHWDDVKRVASNVWEWIKNTWNSVAGWFNTNVITPLVNFFSKAWQGIKDIFGSVVNWFKGVFSKAWQGIKDVFSGVGNFFTGLWNIIKSKFTSIGTTIGNAIGGAFKTVVNSIINFAENTINGFIKAINKAIGLINKIPGVNIGLLTPLSIPKLAKGGIVNSATVAMVGEAGKEAVMPLERNTGWIDELASKIKAKGGSSDRPLTVILRVGKTELARVVADGINDLRRQNGELILDI